jgi:hypothetical protein
VVEVVAVLLLLVGTGVLVACLQRAKDEGWKAPGLKVRTSRQLPSPPPEDMPPPNLTPLIPSQRALASEYERGLRDLTMFLASRSE